MHARLTYKHRHPALLIRVRRRRVDARIPRQGKELTVLQEHLIGSEMRRGFAPLSASFAASSSSPSPPRLWLGLGDERLRQRD